MASQALTDAEASMDSLPLQGSPCSSNDQKRKIYTLEFKLEAVNFAKEHSINATSRKFGCDRKRVREWMRKEEELRHADKRRFRLPGAGRKELVPDLNSTIKTWIEERRNQGQRVSGRLIRLEARRLASERVARGELGVEEFKYSNGWLSKFMERNNLSMRRVSSGRQKPPNDPTPTLLNFVILVRQKRLEMKYPSSEIFAAYETAVWFDPIGRTRVTQRGAKEVPVQTTGHEKLGVTVMLCAQANGVKCAPFVLLPAERVVLDIERQFDNQLFLSWRGANWMNQEITIEFIEKIFGRFSLYRRLLIWDASPTHLTPETKSKLEQYKVDQAVVPGGCTNYIQAPDVSWSKPFRQRIEEFYEDWLLHGEKTHTTEGKMHAPSQEVYLQWITDSWAEISSDFIGNSFKVCGISNNLDGNENHLTHVFTPNAVCPNGLAELHGRISSSTNIVCEPDVAAYESDSDTSIIFNE